ncbi:MAG: DNA cytosine methyltransferase [Synechococcus sp.]
MKRPIAVDLFAGAGGMSLGFEQAGFEVLAAVEIDPIHCAVHEFNFPFWRMFCRSAADITGREIREDSAIGDRSIDVVFGGPPCQGCSTIGKRALNDPRNGLMLHFLRLVLELQPRYFVMENVRGLTIGRHRQLLKELIASFADSGYQIVQQYQVLNAAHFGVPQDRQRLFLMGARAGEPLAQYPNPTVLPARPIHNAGFQEGATSEELPNGPTVADAIADLPDIEQYDVLFQQDWMGVGLAPEASNYAKLLRGDLHSPQDFSYRRQSPYTGLTCSGRTRHSVATIERFRRTEPGTVDRVSRFLKLHPDGLCNTLRAGTPSSRGAFTSPRPIHPFTPRCITVREAARLHSYPDWFRFHSTKWHGFRQIGNSVPPLLARAVASQVIQALNICPRRPRKIYPLGDPQLLHLKMTQASARYNVSKHTIAPRQRIEV